MNWDVFSHWSECKVFSKLASDVRKAVVLLDRATCHAALDNEDRRPGTSWNTNRLISSLNWWGGAPDDSSPARASKKTEPQLLDYARSIVPSPKYKIQKKEDKFENEGFSIKILFLLVAYPELNPIEILQAYIKRSAASKNLSFSLSAIDRLTRE